MTKLVDFVKGIFGGKAPWDSMTAWGLAVFVAGDAFLGQVCSAGMIGAETCVMLQGAVAKTGVVLAALGIRRATNK